MPIDPDDDPGGGVRQRSQRVKLRSAIGGLVLHDLKGKPVRGFTAAGGRSLAYSRLFNDLQRRQSASQTVPTH